jgi:Glycosyltransferase
MNSPLTEGITVDKQGVMTILRPANIRPKRRVLYLNSYGMAQAWRMWLEGEYPGHHLLGCLELVRMGYEVAMPEEMDKSGRFFNYQRQDRAHLGFMRSWLGRDGILYSGHSILFWGPLMKTLGLLRCPIVTLFYARDENPRFTGAYNGIIAMTPAAEERARSIAPKAKILHAGWGVDLPFFPVLDYSPKWFLSCGKSRRDNETLAAAAAKFSPPIRLVNPDLPAGIKLPPNVEVYKKPGDWKAVTFKELIHEHYANCLANLILPQPDPRERWASGYTQLLEAMALARPVIVTKTGAIPGEIDVEKEGCGLFVPPGDADALAQAMKTISDNPAAAAEMGRKGRKLIEERYDIVKFAEKLDAMFDSF